MKNKLSNPNVKEIDNIKFNNIFKLIEKTDVKKGYEAYFIITLKKETNEKLCLYKKINLEQNKPYFELMIDKRFNMKQHFKNIRKFFDRRFLPYYLFPFGFFIVQYLIQAYEKIEDCQSIVYDIIKKIIGYKVEDLDFNISYEIFKI